VEWRNGGMAEWRNGGMAEWRNGNRMAEWRNGNGMAEWRNAERWSNGGNGYIRTIYGRHTPTTTTMTTPTTAHFNLL
jgi:hypothetical protein